MKGKFRRILAAGLLVSLLWGCGAPVEQTQQKPVAETTEPVDTATEPTVPATVPADGNAGDVTCQGSYTGTPDMGDVVARVGMEELTNENLQAFYWAEAASWAQSDRAEKPDFDRPLDSQSCPLDDSVNSWQQFFLRRALNAWHSAQALELQGQEVGLPVEEAHKPMAHNYEKYMTGMPATKYLYRYEKSFQPNTLHQAYLDDIPEMLEELAAQKGYGGAGALAQAAFGTTAAALAEYTELYNRGYMYLTNLSYYIETTDEEVVAYYEAHIDAYRDRGITRDGSVGVDIRQILLVPEDPESEESWFACIQEANVMLGLWKSDLRVSEGTFADLANKNSQDTGTALDGGAYRDIRQGMLDPELDKWCFDDSRQPGDTVVLRTEAGIHILYFSGSTEVWYTEAEGDLKGEKQAALIAAAREAYPMEVDYSAITLAQAQAEVSSSDLLYPDVAHERFPEVPLYLQQDYTGTRYGGYSIVTNGCGITSMAMLASYMTDEELTPPIMCERYGSYSLRSGTDGMIFVHEPPNMGFYLKERVYNPEEAYAALEEGHIVISLQHNGYWTGGGHYIVIEKLNEDGTIQVRDSNTFNYGKLKGHQEDKHTWKSVINAGDGYWIFEYKVTDIPACSRCGTAEERVEGILTQDYICHKCSPAILRRETWLNCGA